MKKLIIAAGLMTALALAAFGTTGGLPVSFAGSWTLDNRRARDSVSGCRTLRKSRV